ncbi:MAG: hypothetical protein LUF29_03035 [Oscillospiraceae bacterium]|nr:hypothetical protein [Oscillospiraceae bacterium]
MANKNYTLIPVVVAIIAIPQLLFWWLAPASANAYLAIYIAGTVLTVGIAASFLGAYFSSSLRKTAGLAVVSLALEIVVVVVSALLLGLDASVRSAVFAYVITALVCVIILLPMICSSLKEYKQEASYATGSGNTDSYSTIGNGDSSNYVSGTQHCNQSPPSLPRRASQIGVSGSRTTYTPLPSQSPRETSHSPRPLPSRNR